MIVSAKRKLIVLHPPKTGGTSLGRSLMDLLDVPGEGIYLRPQWAAWRFSGEDVTIGRWLNRTNVPVGFPGMPRPWLNELVKKNPETSFIFKHSNWLQVEGFFSSDVIDHATFLVPVRNPYERAYSAYKFMLKFAEAQRLNGGAGSRLSYFFDQDRPIDFEEFLSDSRTLDVVAAQPQADWMNTSRRNVRYIRTENLAEDTFEALMSAGFSGDDAKLVRERLLTNRMNATSIGGSSKAIGRQAMELIERRYHKDFECLENASISY